MPLKAITVSEATAAALDWLVFKLQAGFDVYPMLERGVKFRQAWNGNSSKHLHPSSNWAHGGPIIEREFICLKHGKHIDTLAYILKGDGYAAYVCGPTALIAAMRCYVASQLGETVEVPIELLL